MKDSKPVRAEEGITLEELHSALKASARGKKPGSDGLPYEFFSQFWGLLGPELLGVLQESFQTQPAPSLPASMTPGISPCYTRARALGPCWIAQSPSSTMTTNCWPRHWLADLGLPFTGKDLGLPFSMWWTPRRQHLSWPLDWRQCTLPPGRG